MLSGQEQQTWDELRRQLEDDGAEPTGLGRTLAWERGGDVPGVDDLPAAVVGGFWTTIFLVLFGAVQAGLAIGVATALGWALWRWWERGAVSRRAGSATTP